MIPTPRGPRSARSAAECRLPDYAVFARGAADHAGRANACHEAKRHNRAGGARRQLFLLVLPQLRMLPDCLIAFVPAAC